MHRLLKLLPGFLLTAMPLAPASGAVPRPAATESVSPAGKDASAPGSNRPTNSVGAVVADPDSAVEREYQKLVDDDDAAQAEVDQWIKDNQAAVAKGAGVPAADLNHRIQERFTPIRAAYQEFIKRHPDHAKARLAYGSFLGDLHDEEGAREQWEKARELDPKNPAPWNNLATIYGHEGPVEKAFEYFAKAIELNPKEPTYFHNFGTTVYLFRPAARQYFGLTEQQVFDKALDLYSHALKLDPENFPLASDVAQTYYGIKPLRADAALAAWTNALSVARDEVERQGVYLHFARIKLAASRFAEARAQLSTVTNEMYAELKARLTRNLNEQEKEAKEKALPGTTAAATNAPPRPVLKP